MPSGDDPVQQKSQEFFGVFLKAKEFTEELLKENERLRFKIASTASHTGELPALTGDDQVRGLTERIRELEERLQDVETRYHQVEEENKEFADRYIEIEEQNNNLANLYVASYQLHSTLDYREVIRIVQEIVINLIGAEAFHIFVISDKTGQLELETSEGAAAPVTSIPIGEGPIGMAAKTGENFFATEVAHREATPFDQPTAVIPLKIKDSVIGVISINKLLVQKTAFTDTDYELFTLLAGHAATAIFSAKLYSTSARKLHTLQGFLDMLKTQPAKS
jgi:putative methionine-R-sulfoxide reductase with GAF domain